MRIIVTGSEGFIGQRTVKALKQKGHEVKGLDKKNGDDINGVGLHGYLESNPTDAIIHLAAQVDVTEGERRPVEHAQHNIMGSLRMMEYALKYGLKFVFSSSAAVYGDPNTIPTPESSPLQPLGGYGITKATIEQYINQSDLEDPVILRYSNVYGLGNNKGVIHLLSQAHEARSEFTVRGGGDQTRDYVHVDDVVTANLKALEISGTYNVATGQQTPLRELLSYFTNIQRRDLPANQCEIEHSALDPTKLISTGWRPKVNIHRGLETFFNWDI